jgi:hypothetical protein
LLEPKGIAVFPIKTKHTDSKVSEKQMEFKKGEAERTLEIKITYKDTLDIGRKSKHKISVRAYSTTIKTDDV